MNRPIDRSNTVMQSTSNQNQKSNLRFATLVPPIICVIASFFDAWRDGFFGQLDFWSWHIIKWLSWYTPLIYVWWHVKGWKEKIVVIIASLVTWQIAIGFTGKEWGGSMWVRWIEDILK